MSSVFAIVGKAGGSDEAAENTCEAYASLAALVVPPSLTLAVEVDVRLTSDGVLVAIHDDTLERTTNGRGKVRLASAAAVKRLTAGPRGERIPTLEDVVEARGELPLVVEAHDADVEFTRALVRGLQRLRPAAREAIVVASEHAAPVLAVRQAGLGLRTSATAREVWQKVLLERVRLERLARTGHPWIVPEQHRGLRVVTPRFIDSARRRADPVWVYVVNDAASAERLRVVGVAGVFSTRPRALCRALAPKP